MRDTAASQHAIVRLSNEAKLASEPNATIRYVPPERPQPVKSTAPRPWPASIPPGPISALVDVLLGFEDGTLELPPDRCLSCQWRTAMTPPTPGYEACPDVSGDPLRAR